MPRSRRRLTVRRKGDGSEVSGGGGGDGRREGPALFSSERVQKEGSGRCAADAGRKVRKRNEKECNKLAVRLFSTCIKTSSGATDDLESIARHFPRPSIGPHFPHHGPRRPSSPRPITRLAGGPNAAFYGPATARARTVNRANVRTLLNSLASHHVTFRHLPNPPAAFPHPNYLVLSTLNNSAYSLLSKISEIGYRF